MQNSKVISIENDSKKYLPPKTRTGILIDIYTNTLPAPTYMPTHAELQTRDISRHEMVSQFEATILQAKFKKYTSPKSAQVAQSNWKGAKKILAVLGDTPVELWAMNSDKVFNAAIGATLHPAYFQKLLKLVNEFGMWVAATQSRPYQPIRKPDGYVQQRMLSAIEESGSQVGKAKRPLPYDRLMALAATIPSPHYNFLFVTLWLGLRPSELDKVKKSPASLSLSEVEGVQMLDVYQGKLSGIAKENRWKRLPIIEAEQKEAVKLLQSEKWERPSINQMKEWFGPDYGLYSSRKAFAELLVSRGWKFEAASKFLGHKNTKTTEAYYYSAMKLQTDRAMEAVRERLKK